MKEEHKIICKITCIGAQFPAEGNYLFNCSLNRKAEGTEKKKDTKKSTGVVSWWRN